VKILAVIPARAGSKGLKDKNIKDLCGLPLCVYTIKAALESGVFDEIHFSSDSEKYISIAEPYGVSVPFVRDKLDTADPQFLTEKLIVLLLGMLIYAVVTWAAYRISAEKFDKLDI
jgi:CMP-N-acetylneuraminic acid synthetase